MLVKTVIGGPVGDTDGLRSTGRTYRLLCSALSHVLVTNERAVVVAADAVQSDDLKKQAQIILGTDKYPGVKLSSLWFVGAHEKGGFGKQPVDFTVFIDHHAAATIIQRWVAQNL